jgi:hypothetical protein
LFTIEKPQKHLDQNITALPLLKSEVDKFAVMHVDMQLLKDYGKPVNMDDKCVVQIGGHYNGNDIPFATFSGATYDFTKAQIVSYQYALGVSQPGNTIWLYDFIKACARPTFQRPNINIRTMVTRAGILYKKPRKKKLNSGMTRGNCPTCGKITWGYDPYDNAFCDGWCRK